MLESNIHLHILLHYQGKQEVLIENELKECYYNASSISSLIKIFINIQDNDEISQPDALSLLYNIDDKISELKNKLAKLSEND